ncbi:glycoside hydrolase [Blakeslea trispora]|nr:glycoside hydrolase [Blakeslea trispora]
MPAFESTKTGIPYPRVNLMRGVPPTETTETCTAGAGSLLLEFGVLSRLTGNDVYEAVAKQALNAIWSRRSDINLLGNVIDVQTGRWIHTASSTGAGIDSIFEYMLKSYVLFGDQEYKDMFDEAYRALMLHVRDSSGYLYRNVHMSSGSLMSYWIDSLSAFFPGLQVLYGDLDAAIKGHLVYFNIWRRYQALPERFDFFQKTVDLPYYPLRPEFIESTYHLYMATKDPFYLQVGEMVLEDLNNRTRVPCGFATLGDVRSGRQEDRMESFMLSETLKYLYLLFDSDHPINTMDSNYVFTTEGHLLPLSAQYQRSAQARSQPVVSFQQSAAGTCERYNPMKYHYLSIPGHLDMSSLLHQPSSDYAADLVGVTTPIQPLTSTGYCQVPQQHSFSLSFSHQKQRSNSLVFQQHTLVDLLGGYLAKSLSGFKLDIISDSQGYFVKRVFPHHVSLNHTQKLFVPMHSFLDYASPDLFEIRIRQPRLTTYLRNYAQSDYEVSIKVTDRQACYEFLGIQSDLGPRLAIGAGQTHVFSDQVIYGCHPYDKEQANQIRGRVMLISRGRCSFYEKVLYAQEAGAQAVILMNNQPDQAPFRATGATLQIPSVMVSYQDSLVLVKQAWQQLSLYSLPSVDHDPNASFLVRFNHQWLHNLEILNV